MQEAETSRQHADQLDQQLRSATTNEERERLLLARLEPAARGASTAWIDELSSRVERHRLPPPVLRSLANQLAWQAREAGQRLLDEPDWAAVQAAPRGGIRRLALAYVHGARLRYDFRFEALAPWSSRWLAEFPDDAMIIALCALSALGRRAPDGLERFRQAVASPNADFRSRHLCLHAIWFAHHIPEQPALLLELSADMLANGEVTPNLYYWRASALRKAGRYEQALDEIDRAIALLPAGMNPVHQDYVRERELVVATAAIGQQVSSLVTSAREHLSTEMGKRLDAATTELRQQVESAHRTISDSLLKIVEILGLFVALAGFLAGSGVIVLRAATFAERLTAMAFLLGGSVAFFVLLRVVIGFRRR